MWEYNYISEQNELYHHGVKGMKWGVRRYQNKDGTLTNSGKKRYDDGSSITEKKKSNHRLKLEEQYRKSGLSRKQAEELANNRIRAEKILAASAAVTVAACAAYVANKQIRYRVDGVIKSGETLQRIEMQDNGGKLHEQFYAAKGSHDSKRYKGLLGMTRQKQTGNAYLMKLKANRDIKVASQDKAAKAFGDLYKNDPEFRRSVEKHVGTHFNGVSNKVDTSNLSDRNIRKMYDNFNSALINIRQEGSGADKKFYDKLKSAGYGAIQDVNDMKYSGYHARNPLIVFDNSHDDITVESFNKISKNMAASGVRELGKAQVESSLEKLGPLSAAGLSAASVYRYNSSTDADVSDYKHRTQYR